jgi:thymidylate synthase
MPQCFVLLALMAQITGHKPGKVFHKIVNAHIYENQFELMQDVQLKRQPYAMPSLTINPDIKNLKDIETWVSTDDFTVSGYESHDPIAYPFAV